MFAGYTKRGRLMIYEKRVPKNKQIYYRCYSVDTSSLLVDVVFLRATSQTFFNRKLVSEAVIIPL